MERYSRAYRDPNSPLTPILPMANMNVFNFETASDSNSPGSNLFGNLFNVEIQDRNKSPKTKSSNRNKKRDSDANGCVVGCSINQFHEDDDDENKENVKYGFKGDRQELSTNNEKYKSVEGKRRKREAGLMGGKVPKITINDSPSRRRQESSVKPKQREQMKASPDEKTSSLFKHTKTGFSKEGTKPKQFLQSSPVPPKPLSPRLGAFLTQYGLNRLKHIFQNQEIDYNIFFTLSSEELQTLGIENPEDRERIMKLIAAANVARNFFKF